MVCLAFFSVAAAQAATDLAGFGEQFKARLDGNPRLARINGDRTQRGVAAVAYVGSGAACDFSNLQTAIDDAPDGAEIRLQNETFLGSFGIFNKNLTLVGGFEDCTADSAQFRSTLDGTGNGGNTVLDIFDNGNTGGSWTVELENLTITGGDESSPFNRGGGLHIEDDFFVVLTDVVIQDNQTAASGGGIQITADTGATLLIFGDTIIQNNTATDGGGIACIGPQDQLGVIIDSVTIFSNTATLRGGGIFSDNCLVASHAGGFLRGIVGNEAPNGSGGGIAALGASEIGLIGASPGFFVEGDPETAALLNGNTANDAGGGVWLLEGSSLDAIDARIANNSAGTRGGGVDIRADSRFTMIRSNSGSDCSAFLAGNSLARCSSLNSNFAGFVGGAIATSSLSSTAAISQTFISDNSAGLNASIAELGAGVVRMEGNVIWNNPGNQLFRQFATSELELAWSTIADNTPDSGTPPLIEIRASSGPATVTRLFSNIFRNDGRAVVEVDESTGSAFDLQADCLISHELASLAGATRSVVADPQFVDPANGNYHIEHNSPAVDFCDNTNAPLQEDMDDQDRGFEIEDGATPFDAGADESLGMIFSDGFES